MNETSPSSEMDVERRFAGVSRLYGKAGLDKLEAAHVVVIGVGGVGSWAVEALARNAVGSITVIDLDNVSESNFNRQLHAIDGAIGEAKVNAMQDRILAINPYCSVNIIEDFISSENIEYMLRHDRNKIDGVIDCIDDVNAKAALAVFCKTKKIPLIMTGGAGGRLDPTRLHVSDLSKARNDKLLAKVRGVLRDDYGYSRGNADPKKIPKMAIKCVYSDELAIKPEAASETDTGVTGLNCSGFGSSVCVTATFGFVAAQFIISLLV